MNFRVGDKVRRVGSSSFNFNLVQGNIYTIKHIKSINGYIQLEELSGYWLPFKFTLVEQEVFNLIELI